MDTIDYSEKKPQALEITESAKNHLKTTSSWTNFMAILCFISIGLTLLGGIVTIISSSCTIGVLCLIISIVMIFPALYLFRFSQKTKKALINHDVLKMEEAFKNMKFYWMFTDIIMIVSIIIILIMSLTDVVSAFSAVNDAMQAAQP